MTTIWDVKVLYLGHISVPKGATTAGFDPDLVLDWPYLGFLLQSSGTNILVDTGISENFIIDGKAWGGVPAVGGREYLEKALAKEGVTPGEISTVIYTHLHNDHAAHCTLFKGSRFICQRDEWQNLLDPLPAQNVRRDYDPNLVEELKSLKDLLKIDGDAEVTDGIKLYKTPGHSKGSQSVAVRTKKGTVVLVGDQFHLSCMAFPQMTEMMDMYGKMHRITPAPEVYGPTIPSTLVYDYYDYYDSAAKIKAIASVYNPGYIICGHEPSLLITGV